jgi:hypothetical protein
MTDQEGSSQPARHRIDRVLDPTYVAELPHLSFDALRSRHDECRDLENEVSYVRRLCHARLDILRAEADRRAAGGSIGDLVAALPRILADEGPRAPAAQSRLPSTLVPTVEGGWADGLEQIVFDDTLANLPSLSDDDLRAGTDGLVRLEGEVSSRRRELHRVIDAIEEHLGTRHKAEHAS